MNYQFYYSEKWERLREEALRYYGECAQCATTQNLTVHHKNYKRFGGNERMEDLEVLCVSCHKLHHETEELFWVHTINRLEGLKKELTENKENLLLIPKPKETLEKEIEKLRKLLEKRKLVQGMDFIVVHNCHICINFEDGNRNKFKCKKHGQYGCYPSN